MRAADGTQRLNQHVQRKNSRQRVGQQRQPGVATAQAVGHDARADDGAEQGGGACEFSEQLCF